MFKSFCKEVSTMPVIRLKHDSGLCAEHWLKFVCEIGAWIKTVSVPSTETLRVVTVTRRSWHVMQSKRKRSYHNRNKSTFSTFSHLGQYNDQTKPTIFTFSHLDINKWSNTEHSYIQMISVQWPWKKHVYQYCHRYAYFNLIFYQMDNIISSTLHNKCVFFKDVMWFSWHGWIQPGYKCQVYFTES